MAAGAGRHQDQAVHAGLQGLLGMAQVDHVVQHDAAVAVHRLHDLGRRRAQAGDEDRHLVLDAHAHVVLEPHVRLVDDLVHRDRADHRLRMPFAMRGQLVLDLREPAVEQFGRARVERRERADDARLALREHQLGVTDDEHRRGDDGQRQALKDGGQGHGEVSWICLAPREARAAT